ncbi:unnamed protein product [Paramecium sonneborni]|uniref:RING-type domain-containing protein n=1 Tax=Paramecium sonneborni TaxID=65129 RepID=A0A8S1N847_9CILI|nr:unnamed protein product [Paramecium sonneborni]
MSIIDELRKAKFTKKLEQFVLAKRRANSNLEEYQIRKQKQLKYIPQLNKEQICSLCQTYYVNQITTICQHSFCEKCLFDHFLKCRKKCPTCKIEFKSDFAFPCLSLDYWIGVAQKNHKDYELKLKEVDLWKEKGKIKELKVGMKLDILDTVFIWCLGEIKEIRYGKDDQPKQILVHYIGWNKVYDELLEVNSFRLAPQGSNTSQKNVLQYQQSNVETLQRSLHVSGNSNENTNERSLNVRQLIRSLASQLFQLRNDLFNNQN